MRLRKLLLVCCVSVLLGGCDDNALTLLGDDSSYEARVEAALRILDAQEYTEAQARFEELLAARPTNDRVKAYLASALAGRAGLDAFRVLQIIGDLEDENRLGSIDLVGFVLGDARARLTRNGVHRKIPLLRDAINSIESITAPSPDHTVQVGTFALHHAALVVALMVMEAAGQDDITLTDSGLRDAMSGIRSLNATIASQGRLDLLSNDVRRMVEAITVVESTLGSRADENDLTEAMAEFLFRIDRNRDSRLTRTELVQYVTTL